MEQKISTLSENIKLCKFFIAKKISYIIGWSFNIHEFERIKYLSKTIKIKGWSPSVCNEKLLPRSESNPSKEKLKRRLEEALLNLNTDKEIIELVDTASSQEPSNGDMLNPQGIAQAYLPN